MTDKKLVYADDDELAGMGWAPSAAPRGIRCPKCNCPRTTVSDTWDVNAGRRRKRKCGHCGHEWPTIET